MLGMSMTELMIIAALALLLLGPDQLPTIAKSAGKALKELRKATDDLKSTFEQEMARVDLEPQSPRIVPKPPDLSKPAELPEDPGEARAKARMAASLKLVAPEGTVAAGTAAAAPAPAPVEEKKE